MKFFRNILVFRINLQFHVTNQNQPFGWMFSVRWAVFIKNQLSPPRNSRPYSKENIFLFSDGFLLFFGFENLRYKYQRYHFDFVKFWHLLYLSLKTPPPPHQLRKIWSFRVGALLRLIFFLLHRLSRLELFSIFKVFLFLKPLKTARKSIKLTQKVYWSWLNN